MVKELIRLEKLLSATPLSQISNVVEDAESKDYSGYDFEAGKYQVKFRKAKITPKKVGQFVTLWRRNADNETEPFSETDHFDFCIILTEENEKHGLFLFPKSVLVKQHILSTHAKTGKRGFRVYPTWTKTENRQAEKTQRWQSHYFLNFSTENNEIQKRVSEITSNIFF